MKTYNITFKYNITSDVGKINIIAESYDMAIKMLYQHLEMKDITILNCDIVS